MKVRRTPLARWRYPVRQPGQHVTTNRLNPEKFDIHAGCFLGADSATVLGVDIGDGKLTEEKT